MQESPIPTYPTTLQRTPRPKHDPHVNFDMMSRRLSQIWCTRTVANSKPDASKPVSSVKHSSLLSIVHQNVQVQTIVNKTLSLMHSRHTSKLESRFVFTACSSWSLFHRCPQFLSPSSSFNIVRMFAPQSSCKPMHSLSSPFPPP